MMPQGRKFRHGIDGKTRLTEAQIYRMIDAYASYPLSYVPEVDDDLIRMRWLRPYDESSVEPNVEARNFYLEVDIPDRVKGSIHPWLLPKGFLGTSECPIRDKPYGGLPEGGWIRPFREVGVGAQRAAEAIHCILGSLGKVLHYMELRNGKPGYPLEEALSFEQGHITEELEIIEQSVWNYGNYRWADQINAPGGEEEREAADEQVRDFMESGPRLVGIAERELRALREQAQMPAPVYDLAEKCYFAAIALGEAMEMASRGWPKSPFSNPLSFGSYRKAVNDLKAAYLRVYPDGVEWLRRRRSYRYGSRDEFRDKIRL